MDDTIFKNFEKQQNEQASTETLKMTSDYVVVAKNPSTEFASFSGMKLKNDYWPQRIMDCVFINTAIKNDLYLFKLLNGKTIYYVFCKRDTKATSEYKGKLYLSFETKNKLSGIYEFDKVYTLYWGTEPEYRTMYPETNKEVISSIWE